MVHDLYRTRGVSELRYRRAIRYLAQGSYGRVFLVRNTTSGQPIQECVEIVFVDPPLDPSFAPPISFITEGKVKREKVSECLEEVRFTFPRHVANRNNRPPPTD